MILKDCSKGQKRPEENTPNLTKSKGNKVQNTFKTNQSQTEGDIQKWHQDYQKRKSTVMRFDLYIFLKCLEDARCLNLLSKEFNKVGPAARMALSENILHLLWALLPEEFLVL